MTKIMVNWQIKFIFKAEYLGNCKIGPQETHKHQVLGFHFIENKGYH